MTAVMNIKSFFSRVVFVAIFSLLYAAVVDAQEEIRYVAIGDSYSIGTGVAPKDAWPFLVVDRLRADGINISLIANPSRNGWTTLDAMQWELPVLRKSNAGFVTLMIGVNDWVQNSTDERFRENFADLLNDIILEIGGHKKILIINIPDFSATVKGSTFSPGRNIPKGIAKFNKIIAEEAKKRDVAVVDIYGVSQQMSLDLTLVANDGLHPSEKGQALFAAHIYPAMKKILQGE